MSLTPIRITAADTHWHRPFFDLVARVFDGLDFSLWAERGGWDSRYDVFALVDGNQIVASIGRSRMRLVIDGEERGGFQLGAVATAPERRGEGLSARLMRRVLNEAGDAPVILFANETVIDFYPRFGFRRVHQHRFTTSGEMDPSGSPLRPFAIDDPSERDRLAELYREVQTSRGSLDARDYCSILLWHLTYRSIRAFWLDSGFIAVSEGGGRHLIVHECLARAPLALEDILPCVIAGPVADVEFGFDPAGWWKGPEIRTDTDNESLLYVRSSGLISALWNRHAFRFPDLAQT